MTQKHRKLVYELIFIVIAGLGIVFATPSMISSQDSTALLGGILLLCGYIGWVAYFIYRVNKEEGISK